MLRIEWNNFLFLPTKGWLIDIGCRGFVLPKIAAGRGMKVIAVDPAPDISGPENQNIFYEQVVIVGSEKAATVDFYIATNKMISRISASDRDPAAENVTGQRPPDTTEVKKLPAMTLEKLLHKYGLSHVEVLKLNCEGAEEQTLLNLKRPVARQISVEFHRHLGFPGFTGQIRGHMSAWYGWISSIEDYPFERVVFFLKDDWKLNFFALLAKIQAILSAFLYAAKKVYYYIKSPLEFLKK